MNWMELLIKPLIIRFLRLTHAEKAKLYLIIIDWTPIIRSSLKTLCIKNIIHVHQMEAVLMMNNKTMKIHHSNYDQNIEITYLFLGDYRISDTQNVRIMIHMLNSKALKFLQYHLVIHQIGQFNKINKASKKNIKYHITYFNQRNLYQQWITLSKN